MGKFSFDEDAARREAMRDLSRPKQTAGTHAVLIQSFALAEKTGEWYPGTKQVYFEQQSLSDPEDPSSVRGQQFRRYLDLPVINPEQEGHQYPKGASREWAYFLTALGKLGDTPMPLRSAEGWTVNGEAIEKNAVKEAEINAVVAAKALAAELLESGDFSDLVGAVYFTDISYPEKKDGTISDYPRFKYDSATLADDKTLVDGDGMTDPMAEEVVEEEEEEEEAPPPPAKKTAAKPTAKKGKR